MRVDWVPLSASALVAGAVALSVSGVMLPDASGAETLQVVEQNRGEWMAMAALYFVASVGLTAGMPAVLTLFHDRGARTGLTAVTVFTVGAVGVAGLAMLMAFIGALVEEQAVDPVVFDAVTSEVGFSAFLYSWVAAFYLGEVLLAVALLRAGSTPLWIPLLLLAHVATFPLRAVLPEEVSNLAVLLLTVGLSGLGIAANQQHIRDEVRVRV
ncbi:hypothetical protein ACFP3Q_02540 [Nocardioides sp. GCM10027113]|uniref:hypothetical protein n=1 Tax=unclassified Nocardioides TaxID=2615069 RepID=UPI003621F96F